MATVYRQIVNIDTEAMTGMKPPLPPLEPIVLRLLRQHGYFWTHVWVRGTMLGLTAGGVTHLVLRMLH